MDCFARLWSGESICQSAKVGPFDGQLKRTFFGADVSSAGYHRFARSL